MARPSRWRAAPDGLDERAGGAQEAFLVGVEDCDERDFGQVEPFAQQVDADEHVELAFAQTASIFTRSRVSISECMYRQRTPTSL